MFDAIDYETDAGVATVRLDRPDVRNAMDERLLTEFVTALERAESDGDVYAVVVTGAGEAFCAGADLGAVRDWRDADRESFEADLERFQAVVERLRSMGTPSVAAVNGPAVGAGCDVALACDTRIVAPEAQFSEGFVNVGLLSGDGGAWLLPRLVGEAKAKEYLLTGKAMSASEAVDLGLAVTETEDPMGEARAFAERLRDLPAAAVRRTKELATVTPETLADHLDRATEAQWECLRDGEHAAALDARIDGRDPDLDRPR